MALAQQIILLFEAFFCRQHIIPKIHFELEGVVSFPAQAKTKVIDFKKVNQWFAKQGVLGELKAEYWQHQWEYVSLFVGQSPLKEAQDLAFVIANLPKFFKGLGVLETYIKPVVWHGDYGQLAADSKNVFTANKRAVHIPNAIQLNLSVFNQQGENLIAISDLGEKVQDKFLAKSATCSLLFLPEEEAFERLTLKTRHGLANELCSPVDLSGGHQGSIALYRETGKHNQPLGVTPLVFNQHNQVIVSEQSWQTGARIEHRIGASSRFYDPFINVIFALAVVADVWLENERLSENSCQQENQTLPESLYDSPNKLGAISLLANDKWLAALINKVQLIMQNTSENNVIMSLPANAGNMIVEQFLSRYQKKLVI
jgi:hypothetical protein